MKKKLWPAIGAFSVLMLVAAWRLHGKVLAIVLIVLAALLAKTLIAFQAQKFREDDAMESRNPEDREP